MVAAGAVARKWLHAQHGLTVSGWMTALGEMEIPFEGESHIPHSYLLLGQSLAGLELAAKQALAQVQQNVFLQTHEPVCTLNC